MSLFGIERRFEGKKGSLRNIQLDRVDNNILMRASVKKLAEVWLDLHPRSTVARNILLQPSLEIQAAAIVKFLQMVNRASGKK